jgi:radical SAM protein with 4Fe4S-binding SPASM domain
LGLKDAELFRGCQAGKFLCYILNGNVYPCKTVPIFCGNLQKESFEKIWSKVSKETEKISKGRFCINCNSSKICYFGCPGTVFFINDGSKDPLCEEQNGNLLR